MREGKAGWAVRLAVMVLKPLLLLFTKRDWQAMDKIPAKGGCVVVPNHISHLDPITVAHFVWDSGRIPRFLAKIALFDVFFVGRVLSSAQQIPVYRKTTDASKAFSAAVQAVEEGKCVVVHAEGTLTRDPDLWPMVAKTGAARIALASGCPVIPVAQWGPQDILWPYASKPKLLPRKTIHMRAGDPVDLTDLRDKNPTPAVLREATDRIMAAVTAELEEIRGEQAPAERFDPTAHGVAEIGNPAKSKKDAREAEDS